MRLRELRKEKHLTLKQLGNIIGVTECAISQYELGKREPSKEILVRLADFFGVSVDYLLGRTEKPAAISDGLSGGDISAIPESQLDELLVELLVALDVDENLVRLLLDADPADTERVKGYLEGLRASRK